MSLAASTFLGTSVAAVAAKATPSRASVKVEAVFKKGSAPKAKSTGTRKAWLGGEETSNLDKWCAAPPASITGCEDGIIPSF